MRLRRFSLLLPLAATLAVAIAPGARAQLPVTCPFALGRLEPTTTNALLLETHAVYWAVAYQAVPGTRLRISGRFPHSRYFSFNAYDSRARPEAVLTDSAIAPASGSTNPFRPGANRRASARDYTAYVEFGPAPPQPAPNTLYTGTAADGTPNYVGSVWLRVYLPDRGRDITGGVGLPRIDLEPASGGVATPLPEPCSQAQLPTAQTINDEIAASNGPPVLPLGGYPGRNPPAWKLFVGFGESIREILVDNQNGDRLPQQQPVAPNAGFFSDRNTSYIYAPTSRGFAPLVVLRGRAPTFPNTRPPAARMPAPKQVRYFSFCQYDPLSQRVIDCRADDEIPVDRAGRYTVVISTPADRPPNATGRCGVAWVAWGPQTQGLMLYRQLIPASSFAQSIARIGSPGNERAVMGAYYPQPSYSTRAAFERRGCTAAASRLRGRGRRARRRAHRHRGAAPRFTG